jgi:hypothetical protein
MGNPWNEHEVKEIYECKRCEVYKKRLASLKKLVREYRKYQKEIHFSCAVDLTTGKDIKLQEMEARMDELVI